MIKIKKIAEEQKYTLQEISLFWGIIKIVFLNKKGDK